MDGLVFILIVTSIGCGFAFGRWSRRPRPPSSAASYSHIHTRYAEGLRCLLHEQQDAAIDAFVTGLDVTPDTLETHFALGTLWRKRGEIARAIQVHQNILASQRLKAEDHQQAQLELALDFTRSGLLDRAEVLLKEVVASTNVKTQRLALQELIYLYQEEREWERAIDTIDILCQRKFKVETAFWRHLQAHYCCELAEPLLKINGNSEFNEASPYFSNAHAQPHPGGMRWLDRALAIKSNHARALTMSCVLALEKEDYKNARNALKPISGEPRYSMVVVPLMLRAFSQTPDADELGFYLADLYHDSAQVGLIPLLADQVYLKNGSDAALDFMIQELRGREILAPFAELLHAARPGSFSYSRVKPILQRALPFLFVCHNCGFQGHQFYWCCPSCKIWL